MARIFPLSERWNLPFNSAIAEMGSARISSHASSTSSAALRVQTRGEAAAATKKAECKKRNPIESQLALQIQEQELALSHQKLKERARLEQLRLKETRKLQSPKSPL